VGLERNAAALLLKMRSDGVRFGRVVTLGRQHAHLDRDTYSRVLARTGLPAPPAVPMYADALLAALGATSVEAIDASAYQGATIVHDLNQPLPAALGGQFDLVFDGGTLEHVFDVAAAIESCMELLRPQGRFVSATIPNNWCGHGFYQFSPELFFRAFGRENGFSIVEMYIATVDGRRAYRVHDPAAVGARVELCNREPVYLLVHARRDAVRPIFAAMPQQSDYVRDWSAGAPAVTIHDRPAPVAGWKTLPVVKHVRRARQRLLARQRWRQHALTNRRFYTPADLRI
jgi:SAM-dependent methyltransferase